MQTLSIILLSVGLTVISSASPVTAQKPGTPVGYVLEVEGEWYLNGDTSAALKRWQRLPPAGTIRVKAPAPGARIVVAGLGGKVIDGRDCDADGCSQLIKLPGGDARRSPLRVALDATLNLLWGSPDRYALARIRAVPSALSEGVVRLDGKVVDFGPVLRQTGHYYVRWRARPRAGSPGDWSGTVGLRKEPDRPALLTVSNFKPGLYEVNLQRLENGSYETFASAWVLVTLPHRYADAAASFQDAVALTQQWGDTVEPTTARQFLRAHLDYLAQQTSGKR